LKKINVSLYGGKGFFSKKETPLRAEIIYCDKCNECDFYKEGSCLLKNTTCKYGKKEIIKGYTSRASRYSEFRNKYKNDELYAKIKDVSSEKCVGKVGEDFWLHLACVSYDKEKHQITDPSFLKGTIQEFIPADKFNNEFLNQICSFKPYYVFEPKVIKSYQEKQIPEFLYQLRKNYTDIYKNFIEEYSQYADILPNHIDKKAYIHTLNKGCTIISPNQQKFIFDGKYLICEDYKSAFLFDSKSAFVKVKVTEDMTCKITDNNQVCEDTVFI